MKHGQIVIGPAGSGKSTYCSTISKHCEATKRNIHIVNLDPAAEHFDYPVALDIRDLISLDDVVEELNLGPNGGLLYCIEFLVNNLEWLEENLGDYMDDYVVFDCPGQIELYTHFPYMRQLVDYLSQLQYRLCAVYIMDSQFIDDSAKFFSGTLSAMSAMINLELPHINVLSKVDLLKQSGRSRKKRLERFLEVDPSLMLNDAKRNTSNRFHSLNEAIVSLVSFPIQYLVREEKQLNLITYLIRLKTTVW